ncbi:MAG: phenylalanine--tRNA ligase subunit beta [Clostridiales Family XIII bacterium]|jgi:phenylalanyl-tRNA synthetase beta chain|nr:phenylalanine--tRNA ligase subunit beta [Clostridiales Family XIII bacterium]
MLVPLSWLKEYVSIDADTDEFCGDMIMSGSNIEGVASYGEGWDRIVTGRILSVRKHEDSDHLLVTSVDVGAEAPLQIVTGAQNVYEGAFVPVALEGCVLPDGTRIKKGRLRGVDSFGMLCSAQELGFEDRTVPLACRDGIWTMDEGGAPGTPFAEAYGLVDAVVDFDITPNRPDCLSIIGMAREAAAVFDSRLVCPEAGAGGRGGGKASDFIEVEIRRPELCPRYIASVVTGVKVRQSPWWMQKRLMLAGMRPINNIVDITNYVLLEYGHPLHAFDIRAVEGGRIVVDTASEGEIFTTLDGVERAMGGGTLMIRDAARPIGIAGVMGGLNSVIRDDTETILIECACFGSEGIRQSARKLGLRTEASARYEKGVDPRLSETAAARARALVELLGAGTVAEGAVDVWNRAEDAPPIVLRPGRANMLLGTDICPSEMRDCLERLEMAVGERDGAFEVRPPSVRMDLKEEVDLVEEVARIYGYDRLRPTLPKGGCAAAVPVGYALRGLAREALTGMGYNEIQTYSFAGPGAAEGARGLVRIMNPLGEDNSAMRASLLPNMLEALGLNCSRKLARARAFEIGNTFAMAEGDGPPQERMSLSIGAYGGADFFALKGAIAELFRKFGLELDCEAECGEPAYHPGRCARALAGGRAFGLFGELNPDLAERHGINARCCAGELDIEGLIAAADMARSYSPLPRYPSAERDMALVVGEDITVRQIEDVMRGAGGGMLESVRLFDVYRGRQIGEGMKSVAFSLVYRLPDRTLTDTEVSKRHGRLLSELESRLGATLRDA